MNDAHLHMVVNHFPIIGGIFGVGVLATGLGLKNESIKRVAYAILIVSSVFTFASMFTGEGAEELVEELPNVGHHIIHEHEEIAEKFALLMYATGLFSVFGLFASLKNKSWHKIAAICTLVLAISSAVIAKSVGTSGGEIRHTEIRTNQPVKQVLEAEEHED